MSIWEAFKDMKYMTWKERLWELYGMFIIYGAFFLFFGLPIILVFIYHESPPTRAKCKEICAYGTPGEAIECYQECIE